MPTLKPYEAGVQGLRPTETGIEATAAAARRVGGAYSEAAESVKAAGHAIASTVTVLLGVRRVPQAELSVVVAKWDDTAQNDNLSESEPTRTSQLELAEAS